MVSFFAQGLAILAVALTLVSATPVDPDPSAPRFPLRVWTHPRNNPSPFNSYAEIDCATGEVYINTTSTATTGFKSYIVNSTVDAGSPWRSGPMYHATEKKVQAYLLPLTSLDTSTPPVEQTYYQLYYDKKIPKIAGVEYTSFSVLGRDCGGQCGGLALGYKLPGSNYDGQYFIVQKAPGSPIWKLRWKPDQTPPAAGTTSVFVWVS